jgi:hypothetical protein
VLATDYDRFLLSIESYDPRQAADSEFVELITGQLSLEIHYQSLYGRDRNTAVLTPKPDDRQPDLSTTAPDAGA